MIAMHKTGNPGRHPFLLLFSLAFLITGPGESYAVETGTYHCAPVHAVHYLALGDGTMSEKFIRNDNVMIVVTVESTTIHILDSRANRKKSIDIVNNSRRGAITGKSGTRQFYMDTVLHYFYGSIENEGAVAYAEEGRCRRF